jgi:hypothetical protein
VEPDYYSEAYVTSSHFGSEVINLKVEVSDREEDEGPTPAKFSGIKVEQEASYMSCVCTFPTDQDSSIVFVIYAD